MANLLLVDSSDVAQLAMRGFLQRGHHRLAVVSTADEAWDFIRSAVKVDLVFSELNIGGGGLILAKWLKEDSFRKLLPFVFYTAHGDRATVKSALELRVQNFLIKPYLEGPIHAEIAKATANPWRARHFEEEKSFCKLMGLEPKGLHGMLEELRTALISRRAVIAQGVELQAEKSLTAEFAQLSAQAEAAGAWGVVECLADLGELVVQTRWSDLQSRLEMLEFADQIIFRRLNENLEPPEFLSVDEIDAERIAADRFHWSTAPLQNRCPVVTITQLHSELRNLKGCPVVDSSAAAFQMSANGEGDCVGPVMDLVERDPGLAAQMLIAANHLRRQSEEISEPIDDPRLAVGRIGAIGLAAQGRSFVTIKERMMEVLPHFSWPQFWLFQNGVARLARNTCRYLEFHELEPVAYTAGLLHDFGKLLLAHMYPGGFHAVVEYARTECVSLGAAERKFFTCTSAELAVYFAEAHGLPRPFVNVVRWIDAPSQATEDVDLVAVVSLARDFCRHNHLGSAGDPPRQHFPAIEETEEWSVLRGRVFPAFNLRKFELQMHADCHEIKQALRGREKMQAVA